MMRKSLNTGKGKTIDCRIASDTIQTNLLTDENIESLVLRRLYYDLKDF